MSDIFPYTLQWARETSSKTVHPPWGIQMHGFLESTGVQSSNGASIGSAVFVQLTVLTNRQTGQLSLASFRGR